MHLHASAETRCCPVVELRQYTLKPGHRDALIEIFDRHFVEGQESAGMTVIGQFRDRSRSDHFVWLRGFPDMDSRHKALAAFYGGPIWAAHKAAANDTMLDSDDVLLLRPARPDTAFGVRPRNAPSERHERGPVTMLAGIYHVPQPVDAALVSEFEQRVAPALHAEGVHIEGIFVTEPSRNTFARLPVREDANVLVWFGTVERRDVSPERLKQLASMSALRSLPVSLLDLDPTSRSALGGGPEGGARDQTRFRFPFRILEGPQPVFERQIAAFRRVERVRGAAQIPNLC